MLDGQGMFWHYLPEYFCAVQNGPHRILVVGQTPPPFGGQAVMIQKFLEGEYTDIKLFHVRMAFSDDMESVGKFAFKKIWVLFTTILNIWWARFRYRTPVLYYPPSGPNKVPVLRDIILLCATRWLFSKVVFHFHAGGVSTYENELPGPLRPLYRMAYRGHTLAIRTAPQNPEDGEILGAKKSVVIPNGTEDMRGKVCEHTAGIGEPITILFTGVMIPSKGLRVLLESFQQVIATGANAKLQLMGKWGDIAFQSECHEFVAAHGLNDRVEFLGVQQGDAKFNYFAGCDIFCFPSYFEAESFGLVLVEAMQFGKPLVSTNWRGIPSVVKNGENGFLAPIKDPSAVAGHLLTLINDPALRKRMGEAGRRIFEQEFTLKVFQRSMERELVGLYL